MGEKTYNNSFYWQNRLDKNNLTKPITKGSVFCYEAFIDCSGECIVRWSCFPNAKAMLGYIQHITMSTIYFSHLVSRAEGLFITPGRSTYKLLEYLGKSTNNTVDEEKLEIAKKENEYLDTLWKLRDEEIIEKLKRFQKETSGVWRCELSYFTYFEIYENPLEIVETIIKDYEKAGVLEELEEALGMSKADWLDICGKVYESEFMKRKFVDILNNRLGGLV